MSRTAILCVALALGGCTMIPEYQRPQSPVAENFPGDSANVSGDAADIRWRDFFSDPRLVRLIEIALENNRDFRVAALNIEQAQAQYRIERSGLFPRVDAVGFYARQHGAANDSSTQTSSPDGGSAAAPPTTGNLLTGEEFSLTVGTTAYELDLFGRVRSLNRRALETYFAREEARRSVQLALVAEVATQYLTLREQQEQLALARQTLSAVQQSYDLNKRKLDIGTASELDLQTADTQVQTARVNVVALERLSAQAENLLSFLIGQPLPEDLPDGRSLREQGVLTEIPAGLPSDLLTRRPDILAAEHTLLAANADIGAARAAFFPVIALTGNTGIANIELSQLFTNDAFVWSFAPQISVPIFTGGANTANLDVAKVRKRIEIANYEKTIQVAFREVADGLAGRATYDREIGNREALVAAQQRRYDLTDVRYRNGADSYLAVLLAQQDLYAAQRDLLRSRTERLANLVTLYKALGGGWQ